MTAQEALSQTDRQVTEAIQHVKDIALNLEFSESVEITARGSFTKWKRISGIYFFEVETDQTFSAINWLDDFVKDWMDPLYVRSFVANPKKTRVNWHKKNPLPDWMPLYIGKASDIGGRINQHLNLAMASPTFAMKIAGRNNMGNKKFRVSHIPLSLENYDVLAPMIESTLRGKHHPIVGKQ